MFPTEVRRNDAQSFIFTWNNTARRTYGFVQSAAREFSTRVFHKSVPQECPTRVSHKRFNQCLAVCFRVRVFIRVREFHFVLWTRLVTRCKRPETIAGLHALLRWFWPGHCLEPRVQMRTKIIQDQSTVLENVDFVSYYRMLSADAGCRQVGFGTCSSETDVEGAPCNIGLQPFAP